jgi:hypothetical protein
MRFGEVSGRTESLEQNVLSDEELEREKAKLLGSG